MFFRYLKVPRDYPQPEFLRFIQSLPFVPLVLINKLSRLLDVSKKFPLCFQGNRALFVVGKT